MEWRQQSSVSCDEAYLEAQRWIEAVTEKKFGSSDFRSELENGVRLCDLINKIKPGVIKRVNRLPTPIAGLDNLNVFLKACGKLGLKEAQLFHPGDLQDLSSRVTVKDEENHRRLKNVLITIYWLGRRAQSERSYDGPYLNFKAFEGLLGTALSKALQESSSQKGSSVRDSGFGDSWYSEREELNHLKGGGDRRGGEEGEGGGGGHRRDDSLDSLDSLGSRPHSISSENTLKGSSEGCCSDTEADSVYKMAENRDSASYRRSLVLTPKSTTQFNQFLPSRDKATGYVPAPLRKKQADRNKDNRRSYTSSASASVEDDLPLVSETRVSSELYDDGQAAQSARLQWAYEYESGSDSDADRPDPDLVLDDLASRRFHSPAPATPTNFALPINPPAAGRLAGGRGGPWPKVTMTPNVAPPQNVTCTSSNVNRLEMQPSPRQGSVRVDHRQAVSTDSLFREIYGDSEDEDDEEGFADPVQDDLYARKMGVKPQLPSKASYDKFLPKFWTPEEDVHLQKIKLGSQRRPWYKKMQGFSHKKSGSSSDDSDCDVSPWLCSAPSSSSSSSGPPSSHPHTPKTAAHTTLVVGKRQQSVPESDDGSKSTSDIQIETARQIRYEELQKFREQVKESEDKWQDDLSKWKSRRRSVNSDIVKKKEEREQIDLISSSSNRKSKTFKEMQEERENKGGRLSSLSYSINDDDVFETPVISPRSRTLPARSYTTDASYFSSEPSVPPLKEEEGPAALPARGRTASPPATRKVDKVDSSPSSDFVTTTTTTRSSSRITPAVTPNSHSLLDTPQAEPDAPLQRSPVLRRTSTTKTEEPAKVVSSFISRQKELEPRRPLTQVEPPSSSGSFYRKQPQLSSMEPNPPVVSRVTASLPRNYQRSDNTRLSSVVTPKPFVPLSSRTMSLTRTNPMEDTHKRVNGDADASKRSSVPNRYHQFMTPEEKAESSSSSSSEDEEEEEEEERTVTTKSSTSTRVVTSTQSVSPVPSQIRREAPVSPAASKDTSQEESCEMRISLNQKPGSSRDFGFHADWDSTGARVKTIQQGSPAQMCQLQVGDEVMSVNGHQVADMSYTDWKSHMEEALEIGSLIMDIRRHGQNNWERNPPSLPFKSHKTINLTSTDHPTILGSSDGIVVSPSLDFTSRIPADFQLSREAPARPVIDVASNGVHGGFREESVTMRNKETEPISLKNLKRRSEFFETGGSESVMPDIPVPSIVPPSSRWSWDPEEERKRQEKWQKEQERVLQEKYKRDQEKLQEEWLKAQEDIATSSEQPRSLEVNSHTLSPRSPVSPRRQPAFLQWEEEESRKREEEERKRKEEQERQRQAEERRKREEEERELQRLQEERKRREKQQEEEAKRREEEQLRWQRRRAEEEEERRRQEYAEQQRRERERALEQQQRQQQWAAGSYGYASVQPKLSFTDRTKSKSSPQLDEVDKPQSKGAPAQRRGLAHWLLGDQSRSTYDRQAQSDRAASELELERRNILNAMRYREPERVTGGGIGTRKGPVPQSQAELERQQILMEMKKKTPLLTDSSWIRQQPSSSAPRQESDLPPMRRGESLDNLDSSYNSWRSSWTSRTNSYVPNYTRPHSALSGSSSFYGGGAGAPRPASSTLPSSYSMGSLRGGSGTPSSPRSRQSLSSSPSPTNSPEPLTEAGGLQQRSRSVSGKKICTFCENPLGKGAAMIIESLGLCYHLTCFKCFDCKSDLGGSEAGAEVRIRSKQLYCNNCYMRFKSGQPTAM